MYHEAMVIEQPSIDIYKFPCTFALMITDFMEKFLNSIYEQIS